MASKDRELKKYAPLATVLALIGAVMLAFGRYSTEVMNALGFHQETKTVTKTVWVTPWWWDVINIGFTLAAIAVVVLLIFIGPAYLPRGYR